MSSVNWQIWLARPIKLRRSVCDFGTGKLRRESVSAGLMRYSDELMRKPAKTTLGPNWIFRVLSVMLSSQALKKHSIFGRMSGSDYQ